ncbi:MAG: hypothetical protein K2O34_14980, partial [Acetatifactor sp.]|nr:hypothetical protein [Acetatifactor sp.]
MGKMSREDLFREIGEIDEKYVEEADRVRRRRRLSLQVRRTLVTAASLVLCVGVGYAALQLTKGGLNHSDGTSNAGGVMEAAQELYSVKQAEDQVTEGAAPESSTTDAATGMQDNQEAIPVQEEAVEDVNTEADRGTSADSLSEPREERAESEKEDLFQEDKASSQQLSGTPSIEETMNEMGAAGIIWEAARTDAVYGRYVDVQVPEGYSYESGTRWTEGIHVIWTKGMEGISISCRQADEAVSDWLVDVDTPEEYDMGLYTIPWTESVPEELFQKLNNATFRSDQVTQEIVTARSYQVEEQGDVSGWRTRIAILYKDNVLVESSGKGPS